MNIRRSCVLVLVGMGLMGGCWAGGNPTQVAHTPPRPVTDVNEVILEVNPPVALNLDERPGPDGVRVRVYFVQQGDLPVTVSGGLDLQLYEQDSSKGAQESLDGPPFKTWSFTPADLNRALGRTIIGWGYELPLLWGDQVPRTDKIIIRARYRSPTGQVVFSVPVTIQMTMN